jgi:hypothetical protein
VLTDFQDKKYWRRWAACCRANNWKMVKGRLHPEACLDNSEPHRKVVAAARQLAAEQAVGLTPDHLRHACHIVALGRDKSHTKFSNKEFDAVLNYWGDERAIRGLLIVPEDLASEIHRSNPALKTRERQLVFLNEDCIGAYVAKECDRMFGTKDWGALPDADLDRLYSHMRDRPHALKDRQRNDCQRNEASVSHSPDNHSPDESDPDWSIP